MLHQITQLPEDKCIYKRIYLLYTAGLGNIFSQKDIEIAKRSTSFEREYNLKFLGLVGNVFLPDKIDEAVKLAREFDIYRQLLEHPCEMTEQIVISSNVISRVPRNSTRLLSSLRQQIKQSSVLLICGPDFRATFKTASRSL
jgi:hypothetical protein